MLHAKGKPTTSVAWHRGLPEMFRFAPHRPKFRPTATLPEDDSKAIATHGLHVDQRDAYDALTSDVGPDRVLGHPRPVQHVVGADWAEAHARRGKPTGDAFVLTSRQQFEGASAFRHVMSFDISTVFASVGGSHRFAGIHERDLRAGRLDDGVLVFQGS